MCRSVRSRECDGDDEVGGDEAEQTEDEQLARPPGQQPFEHGDRTFAMRAGARHSGVHWKGAKQSDQNENERRDPEHAGCQGRDTGLVAQR